MKKRAVRLESVKQLRKKYVISLLLIGIALIFSQLITQYVTYKQQNNAHVINIAGRQRMLSQKISKVALEINKGVTLEDKKVHTEELENALNLWEQTNWVLQNNSEGNTLSFENTEKIQGIYGEIDGSFQMILDSGRQLLFLIKTKDVDRTQYSIYLNRILDNEGTFLSGMDRIVTELEKEANQQIEFIRALETALFCLLLLLLLLTWRFIFYPAEKQVRETMELLAGNEENIRRLFDIAPTPMFLVDSEDFQILRANQMALEIVQLDFKEACERKFYEFVAGDYLRPLDFLEKEQFHGPLKKSEVVIRDIYGVSYFMFMSATRICFQDRNVFLIGFSDTTDLKRKEERLEKLATRDELTGVLNRRTGFAILQKEIERCKRDIPPFTLCYLDIDHMKRINEEYGHEEGDWCLKAVGSILEENARSEDSVFRYGGDEFLILFHNCSEEQTEIIMGRVLKDIEKKNEEVQKVYSLSISYGLAKFNRTQNDTADVLISIADEKMYLQRVEKKLMTER